MGIAQNHIERGLVHWLISKVLSQANGAETVLAGWRSIGSRRDGV